MIPIAVQAITYRYPAGAGVEAVSFAATSGERFGIVGPNAAGKTTLLRLLSKVLVPQQGEIRIGSRALVTLDRVALARQLAVLPQHFEVAFPFTVGEVVLMGRYPHTAGAWTAHDRAVARGAMDAVGIAALADRRIPELSGGERQLVSLARALAQEPGILLLDEPTAHLDIRHQQTLLAALEGAGRARTVLLVSHDLTLAAAICDRLLLLAQGRVVACGPPKEVMTSDLLERAYGCPVTIAWTPAGTPHVVVPPALPTGMSASSCPRM